MAFAGYAVGSVGRPAASLGLAQKRTSRCIDAPATAPTTGRTCLTARLERCLEGQGKRRAKGRGRNFIRWGVES
jgi:hypothetical protein